jgi:hypothetical protein
MLCLRSLTRPPRCQLQRFVRMQATHIDLPLQQLIQHLPARPSHGRRGRLPRSLSPAPGPPIQPLLGCWLGRSILPGLQPGPTPAFPLSAESWSNVSRTGVAVPSCIGSVQYRAPSSWIAPNRPPTSSSERCLCHSQPPPATGHLRKSKLPNPFPHDVVTHTFLAVRGLDSPHCFG